MSENDGGNNPEDSDSGDEYSDSDLHAGGVSDTENDQAVIAQAMSAEATLSVDVGSSLTHHDWADIDNSDLVAKSERFGWVSNHERDSTVGRGGVFIRRSNVVG